MKYIGSSLLAVYNEGDINYLLEAALHFALEESSLEEVSLKIRQQYESLDSELKKKLPAIFDWVKSNEKALKLNVWQKIPEEMASVAQRAMLESIARCSKRQISWIQFKCKSQTAILYETFGKQFASNTNFCIVQFVAGRQVFPFAVAGKGTFPIDNTSSHFRTVK